LHLAPASTVFHTRSRCSSLSVSACSNRGKSKNSVCCSRACLYRPFSPRTMCCGLVESPFILPRRIPLLVMQPEFFPAGLFLESLQLFSLHLIVQTPFSSSCQYLVPANKLSFRVHRFLRAFNAVGFPSPCCLGPSGHPCLSGEGFVRGRQDSLVNSFVNSFLVKGAFPALLFFFCF